MNRLKMSIKKKRPLGTCEPKNKNKKKMGLRDGGLGYKIRFVIIHNGNPVTASLLFYCKVKEDIKEG